jgi:hypothetical protein
MLKCNDCGKEISDYAIWWPKDENSPALPVCYPCEAVRIESRMKTSDKCLLYFSSDGSLKGTGYEVSNWSKSFTIPVTRLVRPRLTQGSFSVWIEFDGSEWYGRTKSRGALINLRRIKKNKRMNHEKV